MPRTQRVAAATSRAIYTPCRQRGYRKHRLSASDRGLVWAPRRACRRRATRTAAAWTWSGTSYESRACAACGWAPRPVWCASLRGPCQASHAATLYAREPCHARPCELLPATNLTACLPLQKLCMSTRLFSSFPAPPPQQHMREATHDNFLPQGLRTCQLTLELCWKLVSGNSPG